MKVTLHHYTPLIVCASAIRTCWQSFDKSDAGGEKDRELIDRVGNKFKHASTLEHLNYNFYIEGISRALLQELARHRIASLSVKSTRYTLKELKDEKPFTAEERERASKYLVMTGEDIVDEMSIKALENLRYVLSEGISNDRAKYCLPESYKTELTWSVNARSLQNFIFLRSDKAALWEIRELAHMLFDALPQDHKYLFEESLKKY
jgi:thymidylate synthase (FAD)